MTGMQLHWSLDHRHHHGGEERFPEAMAQLLCAVDEGSRFGVLPNYWRGYATDDEDFGAGSLQIERSDREGGYAYAVTHRQEAAGETVDLRYETTRAAHRPLRGSWAISTVNDAGDGYMGLRGKGWLRDEAGGRRLELCIDARLTIAGALLPASCQPTPQWSLFDCLGELVEREECTIDLIDDGEKPRLAGRLHRLDDWRLSIDGRSRVLRGLRLQGPGQVPSHWWLDADGRVILVSTTFSTYVRRGGLC